MSRSANPFVVFPCTIVVDTAEDLAWTFQGIHADADKKNRAYEVRRIRQSLGRYPRSLGDYSLQAFLGQIHIERKSVKDLQGTLLGWQTKDKHGNLQGTARRDRFECELRNLEHVPVSAVIVEGTMGNVLSTVEQRGKKSVETLRKILSRSILAMQTDYRVPWIFCDSARHAEVCCFRIFERFWRHHKQQQRELGKQLKEFEDV